MTCSFPSFRERHGHGIVYISTYLPNAPFSNSPHFTLQDGYWIRQYFYPKEGVLQYEYTDLCSAARNEDLRWVHVTMREAESISPFPWPVIFAVDHDWW